MERGRVRKDYQREGKVDGEHGRVRMVDGGCDRVRMVRGGRDRVGMGVVRWDRVGMVQVGYLGGDTDCRYERKDYLSERNDRWCRGRIVLHRRGNIGHIRHFLHVKFQICPLEQQRKLLLLLTEKEKKS